MKQSTHYGNLSLSHPPIYGNLVGTTIGGRYHLKRQIPSTWSYSEEFEADDELGRRLAIKVTGIERSLESSDYWRHLATIGKSLAGAPGLALPLDLGKTDSYFYEVYDLILDAQSLDSLIESEATFEPLRAIRLLAKIARALLPAHALSVVHADLKPSNILVRGDLDSEDYEIIIIHFGYAEVDESGGGGRIGTPKYMHPMESLSSAGPFIDIYSMGLITLEMLAGDLPYKWSEVYPLSQDALRQRLTQQNTRFANLPRELGDHIIQLVSTMLRVIPLETFTAAICERAEGIVRELAGLQLKPLSVPMEVGVTRVAPPSAADSAIQETLKRLEAVSRSLTEATEVFIVKGNTLVLAQNSGADTQQLAELDAAFSNSLKRSKNAWMVTVIMTVTIFAVIVLMVVLAVTMTIIKQKNWWGLAFGGASVSFIFGTMFWRPFDRLFRATILTQQLELIHIQTVTAFRTTLNTEERAKICQTGVNQLSLLFDKHASPEDQKRKSPRSKKM